MTRDQARAIALEELNKLLYNNSAPPQAGPLPALLVGSPLTIAERLTVAAMAAHVWAGIDWPVITCGPLAEAVKEQCSKRHWEGNEPESDEARSWRLRKQECKHPKMVGIRVVPIPCPDCGKVVL